MRKGSIWAIIFGVALLALIGWRVSTNNKADKAAGGGGTASGGDRTSASKNETEESSYYGDTLWSFLALELWHRQVVDEPAGVTA